MRISDWSSDVCSSDLLRRRQQLILAEGGHQRLARGVMTGIAAAVGDRLLDGSQIAAPQPVVVIEEIGRASCRESVCQYVSISVVAVTLKKKLYTQQTHNQSNTKQRNYKKRH